MPFDFSQFFPKRPAPPDRGLTIQRAGVDMQNMDSEMQQTLKNMRGAQGAGKPDSSLTQGAAPAQHNIFGDLMSGIHNLFTGKK
jgi:hypothetical protein